MNKLKQKFIRKLYIVSISVFVIVVLWGYTLGSLYIQRNNIIKLWTDMQTNMAQQAGLSAGEWIKQRTTETYHENTSTPIPINQAEQEAYDKFIEPVRKQLNGSAFLADKNSLKIIEGQSIPKNLQGKSLRQIFDLQKANGANNMDALLFGVENATAGSSSYVWTSKNGTEYGSWYSFKVNKSVYTVVISVPEKIIFNSNNLTSTTIIYLVVAFFITFTILGLMYLTLILIRNFSENIEQLEKTVTLKTSEADDANRQLSIKGDISKNLSIRDQLTGLYNRMYFEEYLESANTEENLPLSLIVGDVNGLKLVNDALGHDSGDDLLKRISLIMSASANKYDFVSRVGGDEFTIIMLKTPEEKAKAVIDKIHDLCLKYSEKGIFTSIALGLSTKYSSNQDILMVYKSAEDRMYDNKLVESKNIKNAIITSLRLTLEEKTTETKEHCLRMKSLSMRLGQLMNLNEQKLDELGLLALLHDIGKISIPNKILGKPAKLVEEEWDIMKKHPEVGYRIASATPDLVPIAGAILHHHERWDGNGYPHGISGEKIPHLSRIIAVVDAFDSMTHETPYHKAMTQDVALEEIRNCSGTQFDPVIANLFIEMIKSRG